MYTVLSEVDGRLDVAFVVVHAVVIWTASKDKFSKRHGRTPRRHVLMLTLATIVPIPAHFQTDRMGVVRHRAHVGKLCVIDDRVKILDSIVTRVAEVKV